MTDEQEKQPKEQNGELIEKALRLHPWPERDADNGGSTSDNSTQQTNTDQNSSQSNQSSDSDDDGTLTG